MKEIWKPINQYEGLYEVSNLGNVRSLDKIAFTKAGWKRAYKGRMIKPKKHNGGYSTIILHRDGKTQTRTIHRLVAEAFLPNPNNYPEVNHIDENKTNNAVSNLEWCTRIQNQHHGTAIERSNLKQRIPFYQIDHEGHIVKRWDGFKVLQRDGQFQRCEVSKCCRGLRDTYKGYRWEYAPKEVV